MRRFVLVFALCVLAGFGLLTAPFTERPIAVFTRSLVDISVVLINGLGGHSAAEGDIMRNPVNGFAIRMANGCNGLHVTIILWAALLAFPATWTWKLKGLAAGSAAIHGVNLIRFISLFYLGQYAPNWFEFAHTYFWESMILLDALAIFWLWVYLASRPAAVAHAGR